MIVGNLYKMSLGTGRPAETLNFLGHYPSSFNIHLKRPPEKVGTRIAKEALEIV
jgi:hypothetical protein